MIAIMILAVAFLPTIGVFGTSIKSTQKDNRVIRAMNICQDKLDTALKFSFGFYKANLGAVLTNAELSTGTLTLDLNDETIKTVTYRYELLVEDRPGDFTVRERDLDEGDEDPDTWVFNAEQEIPYEDILHRYKMTVYWKTPEEADEHFYTLVTFRADLNNFLEE